MRHLTLGTLFVVLAVAGLSQVAGAQPKDPPAPPPPGEDRAATSEGMGAMLERRIDRIEREETALREAKAMLDRGEPVEKVREYLRETVGEDVRDRMQQWRDRRGAPPDERRPGQPGPRGGEGRGSDDMPTPRRGGPEGPHAGPDPASDGPPLPPNRALELLRDVNPPMFERLNRMRERNPEQFRDAMRRVSPRLTEFDRESRAHPGMWRLRVQMFRLEREARDLARTAAGEPAAERAEAVAKLNSVIGEQFDLRLRMREQEVSDLTERVSDIRSQIDAASKDREALVAARARDMIEEARMDDRPPPGGPGDGPQRRRNRGDQPPLD